MSTATHPRPSTDPPTAAGAGGREALLRIFNERAYGRPWVDRSPPTFGDYADAIIAAGWAPPAPSTQEADHV